MVKYIVRVFCILIILFIGVPLIASLGTDHTYSIPFEENKILLDMPDGKKLLIDRQEMFAGSAAAYLPDETDPDTLRAVCIVLNTPQLTENGIRYAGSDERLKLFGQKNTEMTSLYGKVWETSEGQSLILPDNFTFSLADCLDLLQHADGDYAQKLASVFPGGGLVTEKQEKSYGLFASLS